ncbi:MAG: DUF4625 domain-containing protein [Cyclobacteriaceae bacterium]
MKNASKFLSLFVLLGGLIFTTSCGDDSTDPVVDTEDPTITINAPADGSIIVPGSQVASSISFSDDLEISSISITVGNGTVTAIDLSEDDIGEASFSFSDNLMIPADVVLGEHTVTVTVEDASGNTASATVTVEALPVYTDGSVTIMATVPDQIADYSNETVYAVGTLQENQWDEKSGSDPLTVYTDSEGASTYYIQKTAGAYEFKFVRGLDWGMGEKQANGQELASNNSTAAEDYKASFAIGSWKDYNPDVINNSTGTVFTDSNGDPLETEHTIQGTVTAAATTSSTLSTVSYAVIDDSDAEVTSGTLTLTGDAFSETLDISGYSLGVYTIQVSAEDADGNMGREDRTLTIAEFPCDASGETAVDGTMTRVIISVPDNLGSRDMYATGNINGVGVWGTIDPAYLMTELSGGCYYIDLVLAAGDELQFFYEEATHGADWWRGAATRVAGDGGTAANGISDASSGNELNFLYNGWRQDPPD